MFEYLSPRDTQAGKPAGPADGAAAETSKPDLILLGLSTCAFCKRAKTFLETEGIAFSYIEMDRVDPDLNKRAKSEFKERFGSTLTYPTLLIGENDFLPGFIEPSWKMELL